MKEREIRWVSDIQAAYEVVKQVEDLWGIKFPKEYVDIVTQFDGSTPQVENEVGEWKYGLVRIPKWHRGATGIFNLSYMNSDILHKKEIVSKYNSFKEVLPESDKLFPFADNGGGDILLFDYRQNNAEPAIVFLDHEQTITEEELTEEDLEENSLEEWQSRSLYPVCSSFSEFLDLIYPR